MSSVAPHAGIIDFGEYIPASEGQPARPGSIPAPSPEENGYLFTTSGWTDPADLGVGFTFETVAKNLKAEDYTLNYTEGDLTSIVYANGVTKTLGYVDGDLSTITLSGATPDGIDLIKTLIYTDGELTAVTYT
jgi:hypothetical protein